MKRDYEDKIFVTNTHSAVAHVTNPVQIPTDIKMHEVSLEGLYLELYTNETGDLIRATVKNKSTSDSCSIPTTYINLKNIYSEDIVE